MKRLKKITLFSIVAVVFLMAFISNSSCNVYKFKDVSIPDSIKTVKVNFLENKARYVNPILSPRLTDKLRQKIVGQTRLTQTNADNADWEINGYISEYNLSTSAISGQREAGNRLTVGVHITVTGQKKETPLDFDISRNFEFSANQSLQEAENALAEEMLRSLSDDIFNRLFSNW
jgi:outer membrane lipopolysaccharide assembly protein LptE/RlpB